MIALGKPLAFDGDPRNPEHKSTSLLVMNMAIDGAPLVKFNYETTQTTNVRPSGGEPLHLSEILTDEEMIRMVEGGGYDYNYDDG